MSRNIVRIACALFVFVAACGGDGSATTEATSEPPTTTSAPTTTAASNTTPPSTTSTSTDSAAPNPSPDRASPDVLFARDDIDSYRYTMTVQFEGTDIAGAATNRVFVLATAFQKEPPASDISIRFEGMDLGDDVPAGDIRFVVLDGSTFASIPGLGCVTNPPNMDPEDFLAGAFSPPDELFEELADAEQIGTTTYEGYDVEIYEVDEEGLELAADESFDEATGQFYYSPDLDAVLFFEMSGTGSQNFFEDGDQGDVRLEFAISDINDPVEVAIPDDCSESAAGPEGVPIADDATNLFSATGLASYQSAQDPADIVAFYQTELAAEGWTETEPPFSSAGTTLLQYEMGDRLLVVTVAPEGTGSLVTIIIDE